MDNLNAGAATFTPGGPPAPAAAPMEDTSDGRMLDEIEAAISAEQQQPAAAAGGGGKVTYTDLPPHAEEFWFPECRECTCCNGYKHGCQCCAKQGMRSCKCAPSTGPTGPPPPAAPPAGQWQPAMPGPRTGGGYGGRGGGGRGGGGRGGGRGPQMCRFFTSPGGCRFGDSCRFSHG